MVYIRIITEAKQNHGASSDIKGKAGDLRKGMTSAEKILWEKLRKKQLNGVYFRRQHPYGIYILDFYCFGSNLAIEIDGPVHLKMKEYDNERTEYLKSSGLRVLRFSNEEIENSLDKVIKVISDYL